MTKQLQDSKRICNKKRILSVTIRRMVDESPDTSWLGEYSSTCESQFTIDRKHSEECIENDIPQKTKLERIADAIENDRPVCVDHTQQFDCDCDNCQEEKAYTDAMDTIRELAECDCGEHGDMGRNEFRYFNPSFNYVTETDDPSDGLTIEDVRKYVRQDYDRMERMNRGDWCMIGIRAEAEISLPVQCNKGCVHGHEVYYHTTQHITSGGLWGIESDSDKSYLESVEKEELSDLRAQLKALGFSARAISTAFKPENITEKND